MGIKGLPAYLRRHAKEAFLKQNSVSVVANTIKAHHNKLATQQVSSGPTAHSVRQVSDRSAAHSVGQVSDRPPAHSVGQVSDRPPAHSVGQVSDRPAAHSVGQVSDRPAARSYRPAAVAVDVPSLFYRIMYSAVDTLAGVITFLSMFQPLRDAGITVVFVFDNPRKPNKGPERERRRARANADRKKLEELKTKLASVKHGPSPDQDVGEWMQAIQADQEAHDKVAKRIDVVKPTDFVTLNTAMVAVGYTTWLAKDEGEGAAAAMYKAGMVDAVISDDFDVLALGVGLFIRNYGNYGDKRACEAVHLATVLRSIGLPYECFLQMCVLCGSDFTEHLKGMGPVKARKMLAIYKDLGAYFNSVEYRSTYGDHGPPFEWRVALKQFQDLALPCMSGSTLIRLYCLLVART